MKQKIKFNKQIASAVGAGAIIAIVIIWLLIALCMPHKIADDPIEIPPDTISGHDFEIMDNRLLLMNTMGVRCYDKNGEYVWDYAIKTANPYITSSGNKIAIADVKNGQATVLKKNKVSYQIEELTPITGVVVNGSGYLGVISSEHGYRSVFTIYDDFGNMYYKWHSGESYIVSASIAENNDNIVVAGLSTTENNIRTTISFFDMDKTEPIGETYLDGEVAYKIIHNGTNVYVLTDKGIYCYNKKGTLKDSYSFVGRALHSYSFDSAENIAICLSRTDDAGSMLSGSQVVSLTKSLKEKSVVGLGFEATAMDSENDTVVVSGLRNVCVLKKSGRIIAEGTLKNDANRIKLFGNGKSFVTLEGSLATIYKIKAGF